ncbi:MAG: prepilin-type N-terminal cleavage/methylation domain-containing protein [Planctomycetaceae bacterium]|jgi:prepilin-type N-terminal cleavage/methylation domain-containing protein|nr:prepilin-type N-terminal cleavage/methylation domain-containing protein [Planctomycetaceae bacterium]
MKLKSRYKFVFYGMTLVELLVVMAIMAILVAFSIPALKPMLESQRAANGARVVALKLQQTRLKAMRESRPCGIEFMRFDSNTRVSLQMRTVRDAPNFIRLVVSGYEVRCIVFPSGNGSTATIRLVKQLANQTANQTWKEIDTTNPTASEDIEIVGIWKRKVVEGLSIQFNRQGRWYYLTDHFTISDYSDPGPLPSSASAPVSEGVYEDAVEFNVTQRPVSMLNSVTVLPRGTVIDLQHSGHESTMRTTSPSFSNLTIGDHTPATATPVPQSVIVMFSPAGYVDRFYIDGSESRGDTLNHRPFRGVFYFLVGEWDKIDPDEDGRNNLATPSNFWVTIKDRDGTVRISPNAETTATTETKNARNSAREDLFNNIGGL